MIKMGKKEELEEVLKLIKEWMIGTLEIGKMVEKGKSDKEKLRLKALFLDVKRVVC